MTNIQIKASKAYDILIGRGFIESAGKAICNAFSMIDRNFKPNERKIVIISDTNVFPIYGNSLLASLNNAGFSTYYHNLLAGESSKNIGEYGRLLDFLSSKNICRSDIILTLGGGVVGDIGGFAAATYLRGTRLVHFPTTLLAAVDSSIGGKTAINLENGKNQVGCFYQPDLVICDIDCLSTLPDKEYRNGCSEVIKYAAIEKSLSADNTSTFENSTSLFELISKKRVCDNYEEVVSRCASIKRDFVTADEFDKGERAILNFGHSFGHSIEHLSGYSISHGEAVAIGMSMISKSAVQFGICSDEASDSLISLLLSYGLPIGIDFSPEEIVSLVSRDKKNDGNTTKLIVPVKTGVCKIMNIPNEELLNWVSVDSPSDTTVEHGNRFGDITVPPSKSYAHRHLICSCLAGEANPESSLNIAGLSDDIIATASCINAITSSINAGSFRDEQITLNAGESASTFRFLLPVAAALGINAVFKLGPSLAKRPHKFLVDLLVYKGASISIKGDCIYSSGFIEAGDYSISGSISSQYISGLLMALPLLNGDSTLKVIGPIESLPYIQITEAVLKQYGIILEKHTEYKRDSAALKDKNRIDNNEISTLTYHIMGNQKYRIPSKRQIEGDWSAGAFFLCLGALSKKGITVYGLNPNTLQGDRAVLQILSNAGAKIDINSFGITISSGELKGQTINAANIPDIVPILSVVAAVSSGKTEIKNAKRLRLKESDRLKTTAAMINALGGNIKESKDGLIIKGKPFLEGGTVNSFDDHRIAMSAAIAAAVSTSDVTITRSCCINKSYPDFFKDLNSLEVKK